MPGARTTKHENPSALPRRPNRFVLCRTYILVYERPHGQALMASPRHGIQTVMGLYLQQQELPLH